MSKVLVDVPDDELDQFECRTSEYFESGSELGYEFLNSFGVAYKSDATYESGYWWFDRFYKCVSVRCRKVSLLNPKFAGGIQMKILNALQQKNQKQ